MSKYLAVAFAALALAGPALAQTPGADRSRCNQLMAYYDRYARGGEGTVRGGQIDRAVGADRCREGKIAEGEKDLEAAIRAIGLNPPDRRN